MTDTQFIPNGSRPSGVVPAVPRVIYKTKRNNLTHEGRIGRIDQVETLNAFRRFSHAFNAVRPRLDPAQAGFLHNNGFLPDRGALYGLAAPATPEQAETAAPLDPWLSDFQASILPLANGRYGPVLANRLFYWRLYGKTLPLAPLVGAVEHGRLMRWRKDVSGQLLSRPMYTTQTDAPAFEQSPQAQGADRVVLDIPPQDDVSRVTRMLVLYDPKTRSPVIVHAVLLEGALATLDQSGSTLTSRRIALETGMAGPALRFTRGVAQPPKETDPEGTLLPNWWSMMLGVTSGLTRLPVGVVVQVDLLRNAEGTGTVIVDATDQIDVAGHQVHGPIMGSQSAVRFIREFGV